MKKLLLILVFCGFTAAGQNQKAIRLDELKLEGPSAISLKVDTYTNDVTILVSESAAGEFKKDPLIFVQNHFDAKKFILENELRKIDFFTVTFRSASGYVNAKYDETGAMISTYQNFRDIIMPLEVAREVFRDNYGWTMVSNKHVTKTKGTETVKEVYKVKLKNGNKTKNLRLVPSQIKADRLALMD